MKHCAKIENPVFATTFSVHKKTKSHPVGAFSIRQNNKESRLITEPELFSCLTKIWI